MRVSRGENGDWKGGGNELVRVEKTALHCTARMRKNQAEEEVRYRHRAKLDSCIIADHID